MIAIKNCLALKKSRRPRTQGNHTTAILKVTKDTKILSQYSISRRNCN